MTHTDTAEKIRTGVTRVFGTLAMIAIIGLIPVLIYVGIVTHQASTTARTVATIDARTQASRESRLQYQASTQFKLCSRKVELVDPKRRADYDEDCAGYQSTEQSIATERRKQAELEDKFGQ